MPDYTFDHVHLMSRDPDGLVEFCRRMFGATVIATPVAGGVRTVMLDFNGRRVHVTGGELADGPAGPHYGVDHFGLSTDDMDAAVADLRSKGACFSQEPAMPRPGVRTAEITGPDNVRIELVQWMGEGPTDASQPTYR